MTSKHHHTKPTSVTIPVRERELRALELRRAGCSYREIAQTMGLSISKVHRHVKRAYDRLLHQVEDAAEDVRAVELDRLDRLLRGIWQRAAGGDVRAIDRVLKIMERRAAIMGTDAPRRLLPLGADGDGVPAGTALAVFHIPAKLELSEWERLAQQTLKPPTVQ